MAQALLNFNSTGLGIAEHSHRSELATNIINEAKADLASYLDIPTADYEVPFMQGGGTGELVRFTTWLAPGLPASTLP